MVHDDAMWLDWMTNGMLAIGESYTVRILLCAFCIKWSRQNNGTMETRIA